MLPFALRRLMGMVPMLFLAVLAIFLLVRSVPGDPVTNMLGEKGTPQERARVTADLGLDRPMLVQFGIYLEGLVQGDLGRSYLKDESVSGRIAEKFPATFELAFCAMCLAVLFGLTAGILSAVLRGKLLDYLSMFLALVGVSIPVFWLGLILILLLGGDAPFPSGERIDWAAHFDYAPATGFYVLDALLHGDLAMLGEHLRHLALPSIALATIPMAVISRMTRSSLLETLGQDFVRTARAKGVGEGRVVLRHALQPALVSVITVVGLQFGTLLAGAVLTETVFNWPGLGTYVVDSVNERDYNAVQGAALVIATTFMVCNLVADLLYGLVDPRVKLGGAA
ncbi:MAG: ABC transporter permease [Planctomycetota bacterium]